MMLTDLMISLNIWSTSRELTLRLADAKNFQNSKKMTASEEPKAEEAATVVAAAMVAVATVAATHMEAAAADTEPETAEVTAAAREATAEPVVVELAVPAEADQMTPKLFLWVA